MLLVLCSQVCCWIGNVNYSLYVPLPYCGMENGNEICAIADVCAWLPCLQNGNGTVQDLSSFWYLLLVTVGLVPLSHCDWPPVTTALHLSPYIETHKHHTLINTGPSNNYSHHEAVAGSADSALSVVLVTTGLL